mgnify:CR=1 FL=1
MAIYSGGGSNLGGGVGGLNSLIAQRNSLSNRMSSASSYGGDAVPSDSDINTESEIFRINKQIAKVQTQQAKDRWFPKTGPQAVQQTEEQKPGILSKMLHALSMPVYAVEGALAYTLGKGQGTNIVDSAVKNATTGRQTFGDLLKQSGMPWLVAAPLGFALDITMDPLNWATAGTAAVIPRVVSGLSKAGIKGGLAGLESSLPARALYKTTGKVAGLASSAASHTPMIGKKVAETVAASTGKTLSTRLVGRLSSASKEFDELTGRSLTKTVNGKEVFGEHITDRRGIWNPLTGERIIVGDVIRNVLSKTPKGAKFVEFMRLSETNSLKTDMLRDVLMKEYGNKDAFDLAVKDFIAGKPPTALPEFIQKGQPIASKELERTFTPDFGNSATLQDAELDKTLNTLIQTAKGKEIANEMVPVADALNGAEVILEHPHYAVSTDPVARAARMVEEGIGAKVTFDDIKRLADDGLLGETGVKWFDNTVNWVKSFKKTVTTKDNQEKVYEYGKTVVEGLQTHTLLFKAAKVILNPASWTNAIGGNVVMALMHGINAFDNRYLGRVASQYSLLRGKPGSEQFLQDLIKNSGFVDFIENAPTTFSKRFGLTSAKLTARAKTEELLRYGRDEGVLPASVKAADFEPMMIEALRDIKMIAASGSKNAPDTGIKLLKDAVDKSRQPQGGLANTIEMMAKAKKGGKKLTQADLPSSMIGAEFLDSPMAQSLVAKIQEGAAGGNPAYKLLELMYIKAGKGYETIDQSYRGGLYWYGTLDGFSEQEIMKMRRTFDFSPEDFVSKWDDNGVMRYRVTPTKATLIADISFLNYQAMPGFVRVMRNLPLIGNPFMSFAYGMTGKIGRSLAYNPSIFNKVSFGLQDFGGTQGPIEKDLINNSEIDPKTGKPHNQYYKHLAQDGMWKLPFPFFKEYPVYMNLASLIPYYSLNFFNPTKRSYKDVMPDKLVEMIDQSPFFKDPVGSTLLDYVIQPLILRESLPVGQFGQPLAPTGAGAGEKSLFAARNLVESVVPGWAGIIGGPVSGLMGMSSETAEAIPSYKWRQISNAMQGKNTYGVPFSQTVEHPAIRTARNIAGAFGLNVQAPVNLTFNSNNGKK